jgi:CHAT domain-containing protein/predicted negative regulator of RcsB-dependent stress response
LTGKPVERELAGGQGHDYSFAAPTGRYLRLVIKQSGVDVVLSVYRKGGEKLIEVDKANGTRGSERLSLISDGTGEYYLQVKAREKRAVAGRYTLEAADVRPATSEDEARWSAEQSFAAGKQLLKQDTAASLAQAIEKYLEALRLWRAAGDGEGEAIALLSLANAYFTTGKLQQAVGQYETASKLFRANNDSLNEALTILYVGMCRLALGDNETALSNYRQAQELFTQLDDQKYLAFALNEIGRVYYLQGDGPQARDYFMRAIEIRKLVDDRKGLAFSLNIVGRVLFYILGEDEQAVAHYNEALELQQEIGDQRRAAQTLDDIGRIHFSSTRYQEALAHYDRAIKLQRGSGDIIGEAETLSYMGMIYAALGRYDLALGSYYNPALKIQREAGDRVGEGRTLHNLGVAYFSAGDDEKALANLNAALEIWKGDLFRIAEAETRYQIARVEKRRGNLAEARKQLEAALPVIESLRTKIASQYLRISYFASAQKYYELYIDLLMRMHDEMPAAGLDKTALSVSERARARALLDTLIEARTDIRRGVDADLLKKEQNLQRELTALSQQRILRDARNSAQREEAENRIRLLLMNYQKIEEQILQKSPAYAALTQPASLGVEEIQAKLLDPETLLLEYSLGEERSYLWAVTLSSVTRYVLPKRAEIETAAKRLRELLTARNLAVKNESYEQTRTRVERADADAWKTAALLSEMLALGKATARSEAKRLAVVSDGELQYIPFSLLTVAQRSGARGQEAAPPTMGPSTGSVPLITYYDLVVLPSASLLAELRREQTRQTGTAAQKSVVVLADPVFDKDDERVKSARLVAVGKRAKPQSGGANAASPAGLSQPVTAATRGASVTDSTGRIARLPFTRREADQIIALVEPPNGMKVLDFDASRKTVASGLLARYHIVHFATHGLTNDEHPELSGLLLSMVDEEGKAQDGFLQLHEIYNLNLPADMVVLSACETGVGRKVRGEGLISLTRGFMYAGAKRVVASLWQVNDASTAKFMKYFYQAMLREQMTPASALRASQLEMLRRPEGQPPYFWAAFMLQGDWRAGP